MPEGPHDDLEAGPRFRLGEQHGDVRLDRGLGDGQLRGDPAVGGALAQTALEADCTILSILQALGIATRVLPLAQTRLSRGNLKRRIKEISQSNPAGSAVSRAVNAANGAIIAVITGSAAMANS